MEALKFEELREAKFVVVEPKKEIEVIPWVNDRNEIVVRNRKANVYRYSTRVVLNRLVRNIKRNINAIIKANYDEIMCVISGVGMFALLGALYILGYIFM